jgi:hypothetical protein
MEDVQKTKLQELVDKAYLLFAIKPKADSATETKYTLKDGTSIKCIGGPMKVGCPVHMVDENMNAQAMPDGEHTLSDETVMSVVGGKVSSLTNPSDADDKTGGDPADNIPTAMKEEFDAFKIEFDAFKLEFSELKTANGSLTAENLELKTAFEAQKTEVEAAKTEIESQKTAFASQKEANEQILDVMTKILELPNGEPANKRITFSGANQSTNEEKVLKLQENLKLLQKTA